MWHKRQKMSTKDLIGIKMYYIVAYLDKNNKLIYYCNDGDWYYAIIKVKKFDNLIDAKNRVAIAKSDWPHVDFFYIEKNHIFIQKEFVFEEDYDEICCNEHVE